MSEKFRREVIYALVGRVSAERGKSQILNRSRLADQVYVSGLAARETVARLAGAISRPARTTRSLFGRAPPRLLIAPSDIRTADPTLADDIYAGYFAFAGKVVNAHGSVVFDAPAPSRAWAAALAGFGWLRHLRASGTPLARANARALVGDWIAARRRGGVDWEPGVVARRLVSWLSQSPLLLEDVDIADYRRFMKALGRHAAFLRDALAGELKGADRLVALVGLVEFALCAEGQAKQLRRATRDLSAELGRQILADGGHIGRDPQTALDLLLDFLPLRQAYVSRGQAAPPQLLNAIDRMLPLLRLFRLGDGSLALFNGMGATQPHQLAAVLAHDEARAAAMLDAPYSGYQRLEAGESCLVMDAGRPPPPAYSAQAHAGCLSFEFASEGCRLVVNCGSPPEAFADLRDAARSSAAHSTLVVDDTSSCRLAPLTARTKAVAGWIVAGPRRVSTTRSWDADHEGLWASHDGYAREFGLVHDRSLSLSRDGGLLRGEDRLSPADGRAMPSVPFAIRFHMHPTVGLESGANGAIHLVARNGARWLFRSSAPASIEESIYFAMVDRPRGCEQIVVAANSGEAPAVAWTFERVAEPSAEA